MPYSMFIKLLIPLLIGISGYVLWLSWSWLPFAVALQCGALILFVYDLLQEGKRFFYASHPLVSVLFMILGALYMVPLFLPETGFDALWYHLPITEVFSHTRTVEMIPELYQSAMPRLGSYLFVPSYLFAGVFGVKVFVYLISVAGISWVYAFSQKLFRPSLAGCMTLCVWSFHVFSWQSSSAYVDQIRFLFEIAACWTFMFHVQKNKYAILASMLIGFALATKLISLFFLPGLILWLVVEHGWRTATKITLMILVVALPWYVQAYMWTGNPVYPLFQQLNGQEQLGLAGFSSIEAWVASRLIQVPLLPVLLATNKESYTTPLYILGCAVLLYRKFKIKPVHVYLLSSAVVLLLIPPFSFRYAWTAIVLILLMLMKQYVDVFRKRNIAMTTLYIVGLCGVLFQVSVRFAFFASVFPILQGKITQEQYIQEQEIPLSSGPFTHWYGGYWRAYQYNSLIKD